jgi:hypothetical protein
MNKISAVCDTKFNDYMMFILRDPVPYSKNNYRTMGRHQPNDTVTPQISVNYNSLRSP